MGVLSDIMISKLHKQTFTSEFDSHWVPHSHGLLLHLSIKLRILLNTRRVGILGGVIVRKLHEQTFTSDFDSYWLPHSYCLVPHLWGALGMTLKCIWWEGSCVGDLGSIDYFFIAITPRSTVIHCSSTC